MQYFVSVLIFRWCAIFGEYAVQYLVSVLFWGLCVIWQLVRCLEVGVLLGSRCAIRHVLCGRCELSSLMCLLEVGVQSGSECAIWRSRCNLEGCVLF